MKKKKEIDVEKEIEALLKYIKTCSEEDLDKIENTLDSFMEKKGYNWAKSKQKWQVS